MDGFGRRFVGTIVAVVLVGAVVAGVRDHLARDPDAGRTFVSEMRQQGIASDRSDDELLALGYAACGNDMGEETSVEQVRSLALQGLDPLSEADAVPLTRAALRVLCD